MEITDFFNFFLLISALHGFLFCFLLFFSKNGKAKSTVFIMLLVLAISLNNFQSWLMVKKASYSFLKYVEVPWHFLIAPFFYMFLIHYLKATKKQFNILKIMLPVFLLLVVIRICFTYYYNNQHIVDVTYLFKKYRVFEEIISVLFSLGIYAYSFSLFLVSKKEKAPTETVYYDNLKWIYNFFLLSALGYLLWLIPLIITLFSDYNVFIYSYYPLRIFTTVLIYWLGYQSVIQLKVANERKYLREQLSTSKNNISLEKTTSFINDHEINIPEEVIQSILNGLVVFEENQEYTSQKITLTSLAKKLNTNTNYLSKVINHYKNTSFSNYLNVLRINNIDYQLKNNSIIRKFTIKAIAQEAGFNNADSFSKVFFKLKGVRPSDYIKNLENNSPKEL